MSRLDLTRTLAPTALAVALALGATMDASAHDPVTTPDPTARPLDVPLHDDLGTLSWPVDTASPLAQRYFDQGLRLTWAFNHGEALRSYRAAQAADPACAMCWWGEAYVLGPNINAPMDGDAAQAARAAISRARALAHTPKERAVVEALAIRYRAPDADQRGALDAAYADAMLAVHAQFPDDAEVGVLVVDAIMNTSPWDYWEADGNTPKGRIATALETAEAVLAREPDHPGAIHLYIHLTEASRHPERAEPYADKLAALVPGAGHLVHMPAHTYYRVGRFQDSAQTNKVAVAVDERSFERMVVSEAYRQGYYPHNIHFVVTSAQMAGDAATALEYAARLEGKISDETASRIGWVQAILPAPYFAHAQFSDAATILALPDPGERFPLVKAMWHYARGVAHARAGAAQAARDEALRIAAIAETADFEMLRGWGVPAPDMLRIARLVVEARAAQAEGRHDEAVRRLELAVAVQDTLPYTEPPYWYYPVRQSLAAALLDGGRPDEAVRVAEASLDRVPGNVHALDVLRRAQTALGRTRAADEATRRLRQASIGGVTRIEPDRI
ncbi:MAG: hypothetical protein H6982_15220 [Chromatiales bacterium]|nr:hypothetical protein [Chromatiales bacterium]